MAVVINEFEVEPPPAAPASAPQPAPGGGAPAAAEGMQKIERAMQVDHERRRRLAAY